MPTRCEIFCEILIAVLLPPVGVCLRHGCCSVRFSSSNSLKHIVVFCLIFY
ncbi:hypothetical protein WN944_002976 [Citrus x changshan-huyou]|uniref:Uncharacterized protein n=1 Tax=Citrus x changshan-huyou TaxID=2935761 RepID=A0AAP0MJL8_9ROSI